MSEQHTGGGVAVLLVDDNPTDALLMKAVVEAVGAFEVTTAVDGDAGEALIVSQEWALALVDLVLPGKDGIEVIQAGKRKYPNLPVIIVTGSSNAALLDAAFRAGADVRISKPIDPDELSKQIRSLLGDEAIPAVKKPSPAVEVKPSPTVVTKPTPTVVAVGACPGDVEMGCGGVLLKHREEGHKVVIVNLAGGGDPNSPLSAGARLAAKLLEAEMKNMGSETSHVVNLDGATAALKEVFESSGPGMLYVPTASSERPSSLESHRVALALSEAIPNVLAYQDPGATVDFKPEFFVDLTSQMNSKLKLVALYDGFGLKNVNTALARATALFWGRFADAELVEPLEVIRRGSG